MLNADNIKKMKQFFILQFLPTSLSKFLILILLTSPLLASNDSMYKLSQSPEWVRSLHYKKSFIRTKLATKVQGFYFSPVADPYQELLANLKEASEKVEYQCLFPYRAKLLERSGLWKRREVSCTAHLNWKGLFDQARLSLAFASQYMSNPASVFGHTFLVFSPDRSQTSSHPEYLDVTIGYAAEMPPGVGSVKYVTHGLGGGFQGKFFDEPFYQRIHEYSNMELRDLWMYPMKISSEKIDDLLDHIYEISRQKFFAYYFLDENCSYMILQVLEVIFPDLNFLDDFPFYVIPHETIKTLHRKKILEKGYLIPSLRTKFLKEFKALKPQEKKNVRDAISGKTDEVNTKDSVDALITYMDKRKLEKKDVVTPEEQKIFQALLIKRSKLGPKEDKVLDYPALDPIQSHHPYGLSLRTGSRSGEHFQEFEFRPTVHDLLDTGYGHIRHSQMKILTPTLRLQEDGGIRLQRLQIFNLANIVPYHYIDPLYSWTFVLERDHLLDDFCFNCSATKIKIEFGASFNTVPWLDYYFLGGVQSDFGDDLKLGYRSGPGASTGFIINFSEKLKLNQSTSFYYADEVSKFRRSIMRFGLEGSYNFSQSLSLKASFQEVQTKPKLKGREEISTALVYYF